MLALGLTPSLARDLGGANLLHLPGRLLIDDPKLDVDRVGEDGSDGALVPLAAPLGGNVVGSKTSGDCPLAAPARVFAPNPRHDCGLRLGSGQFAIPDLRAVGGAPRYFPASRRCLIPLLTASDLRFDSS
jgi:hypothetical protein